jgi:hypothetical protein
VALPPAPCLREDVRVEQVAQVEIPASRGKAPERSSSRVPKSGAASRNSEVGTVGVRTAVLAGRHHDDNVLAVPGDDLRAVLERATDELAEPLLGLL